MASAIQIGSFIIARDDKDISHLPQLVRMVSSVTAEQIELIGFRIGDRIGNNLGMLPKARIDEIVNQKRGIPLTGPEKFLMMLQNDAVEAAVQRGDQKLLSEEKHHSFVMQICFDIKEKIAESFSTPVNFIDQGIQFSLFKYEPEGILKKTAESLEIEILPIYAPQNYFIEFKVDIALSNQQQALVFSVIEKSRDIEFDRDTFTIAKLEEEFFA